MIIDDRAFYPAKKIADGLWVGSLADSQKVQFLSDNDVALIVNCSRDLPFANFAKKCPGVTCFRVAVDDNPTYNECMARYLPQTTRLIHAHISSGKNVLVHCYAGIQRSSTVAGAYLMSKYDMTPVDVVRYIKGRKREAFTPWPTFARALDKYYDDHVRRQTDKQTSRL